MPDHASSARRDALHKWLISVAVVLIATVPLLLLAITVPLSPLEQGQVGLALLVVAALARGSAVMRPMIIFLSGFASTRYFYWRVTSTVNMASDADAAVSLLLLAAETYGVIILFLGYFQTVEVVRRVIPAPTHLPSVDVFITTYNESIEIVRRTVLGALAMDYPRKRVYLLDDGRREEMRALADALGCDYLTRDDNRHAKAGNLNAALRRTSGELVAIFDADHVPVTTFLQRMVGGFDDPQVALVQGAQHFFNPDPYERNLAMVGRIAPEQMFFYHVVQPGNDFWNSAFFCGSCAVLRRSALESIGGFKTETVTEDAHTAIELHAGGYRSLYQPLPLAAGLATETFAAHVRQRMRWARGMAQILRIDCPLWKRGLTAPQRLNYMNAVLHFFFGIPRFILLAAPLTYLLLGVHPIKADALAVFAYILPHVGLSIIANSIISRQFRHSFWSSVYEISVAPFVIVVTLLALVNPRLGRFVVTEKGTRSDRAHFDLRHSWLTLALLAASAIGLGIALPLRLLAASQSPDLAAAEIDALLINGVWAVGNFVVLLAAACVAYEQPQERNCPRIRRAFRCTITWNGGRVQGETVDVSETGLRAILPAPLVVPDACAVALANGSGAVAALPASLVRCDWNAAGQLEAAFHFPAVDAAAHRQLVALMFGDERGWTRLTYPTDQPVRSFWYLLTTFWRVTAARRRRVRRAPRLEGNWAAWYGDQPCRCLSLSTRGARLQFPGAAPAALAPLRVVLESNHVIPLVTAAARRDSNPTQLRLQFQWTDGQEERAFARRLWAARRHPRWSFTHVFHGRPFPDMPADGDSLAP
jgi:cellulose synthase (UDP-forming)